MNREEFSRFRDDHYAAIAEINDRKGKDYAGDDDALANFKAAAAQLGVRPEIIWAVYAHKHWSAVMSYCKEGQVESEPIEGRIHDVILYCFLLLGLVQENEPLAAPYIRCNSYRVGASMDRCELPANHHGAHELGGVKW